MYIKHIYCIVDSNLKNEFSIAQKAWKKISVEKGFIAQIGGWSETNPNKAVIISIWKNKKYYHHFMENVHDLITNTSKQAQTYAAIKTTFEEKIISKTKLNNEIQKAISNNFFADGNTKVLIENSWTVLPF